MELAIPGVALGLFYIVSNQKKKQETFENNLPNTDVPNRNFPEEYPVQSAETDETAELVNNNKFNNDNGVYTDKYFNKPESTSTETNYYSLTGKKVSEDYFSHGNMTPYFGSNVTQSNTETSSYEGVLDNYAGSGSQHISKDAQAPLFSPSDNMQWTHGAPNSNDFYRDRVNPSMKNANVNPFKEAQVAPGLGLKPNENTTEGFNAGLMARETWMPKTVDEMRTSNNPRAGGINMLGHEGPANAYNKNIPTKNDIGVMEKNRPDRMFELDQRDVNGNSSQGSSSQGIGRLFVTTGSSKGTTMRSVPINKHVNRPETTTDYVGGASYQNEATYVPGEYMPSHNQQLGSVQLGVANANGRNFATEQDFESRAKKAYPNNRTSNKNDGYFGAVSGSLGAAVAPLLDILRPSRRSNTIGTLRPYQNPSTAVKETYIFDPNDKLPTTMRETTEDSKFHMNVNRNQLGGAYQVTDNQVAKTNRNETGDFFYAGNASAGSGTRGNTSYEANYQQRNNDIKSSTIEGYMVKGNMKLLNNDINMRQNDQDHMLKNRRDIAGSMAYNTPDSFNMGQMSGQGAKAFTTINEERIKPDINEVLKSNPYVVDYKNAL